MTNQATALCSMRGCDKPVAALALCWKHYARQRRNGHPSVVQTAREKLPQCIEPGCDRPVRAKGRCGKHHKAFWRKQKEQSHVRAGD